MMFLAKQNYELAIMQLIQHLSQSGLQVMRTFDLGSACADAIGTCSHHGSAPCDCRLTMLMLFGQNTTAVLAIHQCDGRIWLSLVDEAQQQVDPAIEASVASAIAAVNLALTA